MAVGAARGRMLLVAVDTQQGIAVCCTLVFHFLVYLLMAGCAQPPFRLRSMIDFCGQMSVMAGFAILGRHGVCVGFVTLETGQDFGMALVTRTAAHLGMRARYDLVGFCHGIVMTAQTGVISL